MVSENKGGASVVDSLVQLLRGTLRVDYTNEKAYTKFKLKLWILFTLIVLFVGAPITLWLLFGPLKPDTSGERRQAARVCAEEIRAELRKGRDQNGYRSMTCVPFVGDSTDTVFSTTTKTLSESGTFDVRGLSPINRVRRFLGLSFPATDDAKIAARKARRGKADVALVGSVRRFEQTEDGVDLVVEYRLIDAKTGLETFSETYDSKAVLAESATSEKPEGAVAGDLPVVPLATSNLPKAGRVALSDSTRSRFFAAGLWLLAALAIPVVSFRFLENAAAKRSNGANLFALSVCLAADALCAWLFVAPTFRNWLSWLGVVVMALFALWYNLQMLYLAHRRTEPTEEPIP